MSQCLSAERRLLLTELTRKQLNKYHRGKIPDAITQSLDIVQNPADLPVDERALYYLYSGQPDQAWALNPAPRTKQRIIFYSGKWEWLKDPVVTSMSLGADVNSRLRRAQLAAYMRLAGDHAKSEELLNALRKELEDADVTSLKDSPDIRQGDLFRALSMCGEGKLVSELIAKTDTIVNSDVYTNQFEHAKVLTKFGLDPDLKNFDEWLRELPGKLNPNAPSGMMGGRNHRFYIELLMFMIHTGFIDEAKKLYTTLLESTRRLTDAGSLQAAWEALSDRAENHQVRKYLLEYLDDNDARLKPEDRRLILTEVFPDWDKTAPYLWQFAPSSLTNIEGQTKRWQALERLWRYDRSLVVDESATKVIEQWLNSAQREASKSEDLSENVIGEVAKIALNLACVKP